MKAQAFYAEVLGWKVEPWGDSTYDMILAGAGIDTMIGGYTKLESDQEEPRWWGLPGAGSCRRRRRRNGICNAAASCNMARAPILLASTRIGIITTTKYMPPPRCMTA